MTSANRKVVRIEQSAAKKKLSTAQKQFNNLIARIDKLKHVLLEWKETIPKYIQRVQGDYDPLWDTYNNHRIELVHLFDTAYTNPLFKKTDKNKLKRLISDIAGELISEHGKEELKPIYNKYNKTDFDADEQEIDSAVGNIMRTMVEGMFGVDLGDNIDINSPEQLQALLKEKLGEKEAKNAERRRKQEERQAKRKKSAKQIERETKQKQEELNVSKSIQEVYRKLATALHPDREKDAQERERKTALMQRVNVAYDNKDLLQLLELQLEVEQIDQKHINNIAEDRLKYYVKILKEQAAELEDEISHIEYPFRLQLNIPPFQPLLPKSLINRLEYDIKDVENDISRITQDLSKFKEPAALKQWLKTYKIPKEPDEDEFADMLFGGLGPPFRF